MKRGDIFLSVAESYKLNVITKVINGEKTVKEAADMLGLCKRQVKRLKKGVRMEGAAAVVHGNRGRTPKHAVPEATRSHIVEMAVGLYREASCQHMAEFMLAYIQRQF